MHFVRIRELREENDLTQEMVADYLKVQRSTYGYYETGKRRVSMETLYYLAEFYKVNADYLLGRTDERGLLPKSQRNWDIVEEAQKDSR